MFPSLFHLLEMRSKIPSLHRIIDRVTGAPFKLNEVQKTAVTMAAKQSFTTIQGPPGKCDLRHAYFEVFLKGLDNFCRTRNTISTNLH